MSGVKLSRILDVWSQVVRCRDSSYLESSCSEASIYIWKPAIVKTYSKIFREYFTFEDKIFIY